MSACVAYVYIRICTDGNGFLILEVTFCVIFSPHGYHTCSILGFSSWLQTWCFTFSRKHIRTGSHSSWCMCLHGDFPPHFPSLRLLNVRTHSKNQRMFLRLFSTRCWKPKLFTFTLAYAPTWYPHTWTRRQEIDTLLPLICYFFLHADGLWGFAPATVSCYYNDSYVICHLCQYALRTVTDISDRRVSHLSDIAIFYPYVMLHGLSGLLSVFAVARLLIVRDIFFEIWMSTVFFSIFY